MSASDVVADACRRAGHQLADAVFQALGSRATEAQIFLFERHLHSKTDLFLGMHGATEEQLLHSRILIGHAVRSRYENLVRSSSEVEKLKANH